jgi:hypothetical protein
MVGFAGGLGADATPDYVTAKLSGGDTKPYSGVANYLKNR